MVESHIVVSAPPEAVFNVLADPDTYPEWLAGAKDIRSVEGNWPEPGSAFHHRVGIGPLQIADHTEVVQVEPPLRLVLEAKARPTGTARVDFVLTAVAVGTKVVLAEEPIAGPSHILWRLGGRIWMAPLLRARNDGSLTRLRDLVEARVGASPED